MSIETHKELLYVMTINPAGIFKKEFLLKYNIKHNESPGASYQDNGFWMQTTYLAKKILFLTDILYYYRQDNPNQSIHQKDNIYVLCNEYLFIDKIFDKYENLKEFKKYYVYRKYIALMWHMTARISYKYWNKYLCHIQKIFRLHYNNNEIDDHIFSSKDILDINLILKDINLYIKKYVDIKVSIIIPIYNSDKFLKTCLDSIINQTLSNIEIICINDGSTDHSLNIINNYLKKDSRIILINQEIEHSTD